jgi:NAD(P)-dependent dehydrogenase (short-subunit alcohol dehydrogenase family)
MPVIAIAGSSGLIGSALAAALRAADHPVVRIVRRAPANSDQLHWNPDSGEFDADALTDVDAVVNLLRAMGLRYATVTGIARDDLPDGGAWLYATTVRAIKELNPSTGVDLLIPDFNGEPSRLAEVRPEVWRTTSKRLSYREIAGRRNTRRSCRPEPWTEATHR